MLKAIVRTLIILVVAAAIGWSSVLLVDRLVPASARGGFRVEGGNPAPGNLAPAGTFPQPGFRGGDDGGREGGPGERGGFALLGGLAGIVGHIFLFAVITLIVVAIGSLLSKRSAAAEQAET